MFAKSSMAVSVEGRGGSPNNASEQKVVREEVASTADSANRKRDRRKVEAKLKLSEVGDDETVFSDGRSGERVAQGYVRVVYGDHGAYIECRPDQVVWEVFEPRNLTAEYYDLYRSVPSGRVHLYLQKHGVQNQPNPPQGRDSCKHHRSEGYADYQPGFVYISVKQVDVTREGFAAPRTYKAPAKGKPHCEVIKGALKKMPGVTILDALVREVRVLKDGKNRRYTRVPPDVLGSAAGCATDACLKAALWLADGRPVAVTVVPRSSTVNVDALESFCGRSGVRMASGGRQFEAAAKVQEQEAILPLHPQIESCPVLIAVEAMQFQRVAFQALCGVVATVRPQDLPRAVRNARVLDIVARSPPASDSARAGLSTTQRSLGCWTRDLPARLLSFFGALSARVCCKPA